MRKSNLFICAVFAFIFQSCFEQKPIEYNNVMISTYCDSFLQANYKARNNDILQSEADKLFKNQLPSLFKRNIFDDYYLRVYSINKLQNGLYSIIMGRASTDFDKYKASFDLIALTDKKTALEIDKSRLYTIRGSLHKINPENYWQYGLGISYTPSISIRSRSLSMGILVINNTTFIKSEKKFIL